MPVLEIIWLALDVTGYLLNLGSLGAFVFKAVF